MTSIWVYVEVFRESTALELIWNRTTALERVRLTQLGPNAHLQSDTLDLYIYPTVEILTMRAIGRK